MQHFPLIPAGKIDKKVLRHDIHVKVESAACTSTSLPSTSSLPRPYSGLGVTTGE